ncbi:hypothetical protein BDQ17DRAFT_414628 [Cyathus striatus]|nr:hypothetical protein BDQ17DRAFT_414628 [Cyathus striatus]
MIVAVEQSVLDLALLSIPALAPTAYPVSLQTGLFEDNIKLAIIFACDLSLNGSIAGFATTGLGPAGLEAILRVLEAGSGRVGRSLSVGKGAEFVSDILRTGCGDAIGSGVGPSSRSTFSVC